MLMRMMMMVTTTISSTKVKPAERARRGTDDRSLSSVHPEVARLPSPRWTGHKRRWPVPLLPLGIRAPILAMAGRCAADVEDARLGLVRGEFGIFEDDAPFACARDRVHGKFVEVAGAHQLVEAAR